MTVVLPTSIDEAVSALADPDIQVLAGGTDFMVEVNAGLRRPEKVLSLRGIPELRTWQRIGVGGAGGTGSRGVRLGASVTYTDMLGPELAELIPALAQAARTVGSPPIRNAGTIGGNLATASPAGDTLPVLAALDALVEVAGPSGRRDVPIEAFITGPKRNALDPGELIVAVRLPVVVGHQEFRKIGVRNAMVIAVASLALAVDTSARSVRCALGSVGPVPIRAHAAEEWLAAAIDWVELSGTAGAPGTAGARAIPDLAPFGRLVAEAARPIDDHRGTASYRRHAVGVLAERAAMQALSSLGPDTGAAA
ncbi:MAG: FAD binding domain-containing protein [Actinomycetota bacterium]|nr:FAD binding domain-containing protein [Actinomycetota bacterium]